MSRVTVRRCVGCAVGGVLVIGSVVVSSSRQGKTPAALVEEQLIVGPLASFQDKFVVSNDGLRAAWLESAKNKKLSLILDGKAVVEGADGVFLPVFSPDSRRVAYGVTRAGEYAVVVDGVEEKTEGALGLAAFSQDSRDLAYATCRPDGNAFHCVAAVRGQPPGPEYEDIARLFIVSGAPPRLVYTGLRNGRWRLVVDHKEIGPTLIPVNKQSPFNGFMFSPNGHFACVALGEETRESIRSPDYDHARDDIGVGPVVLLDGRPVETFKLDGLDLKPGTKIDYAGLNFALGAPVLSPDGTRVAYAGLTYHGKSAFLETTKTTGRIVVDGKQLGPLYPSEGQGRPRRVPVFAGDGAFPMVVRGMDPLWAGVSNPVFSPDGKRVAHAAKRGNDDYVVVLDGEIQRGPALQRFLAGPTFSRDGQHLAYVGWAQGQTLVVVDGAVKSALTGKSEDFVEAFTYTPKHLTFVTGLGDTLYYSGVQHDGYAGIASRRIVVDGVVIAVTHDSNGFPAIVSNEDETSLAYVVPDVATAKVAIDGQEGNRYNTIYSHTLRFTDPATVTFVAQHFKGFVRVTQRKAPAGAPAGR